MTLINIKKNKVKQWPSRNVTVIEGEDPYTIASKIALHDWSYSDDAVIAVIDNNLEKQDDLIKGEVQGILPLIPPKKEHFTVEQTNNLNPQYHEFLVPNGYKFLKARCWYPCFYFGVKPPGKGFENILNISIPPGDRDMQLYCENSGGWMEVEAVVDWNTQSGMDTIKTDTYVYKNGRWSICITDVPTKGPIITNKKWLAQDDEPRKHHSLFDMIKFGRYGSIFDVLKSLRKVEYQVDVEMYPGIEVPLPEKPDFGCTDATFTLTWDNSNAKLGFSLIGPAGEEIANARNYSANSQTIQLERIGECLPSEQYWLCVYALDNTSLNEVNFKISYKWHKTQSRKEIDAFSSASEGAILASIHNAPLLYTSPNKPSRTTIDALYKLGVKNIYLVDIGKRLSKTVKNRFSEIAKIKKHYTDLFEMYSDIKKLTDKNDIIISTINPWSYWFVAELKPAGEFPYSLFIGPAAYIAAQHGSPLFIVEAHPELYSSVIWPTEFWKRYADGFSKYPNAANMHLIGMRVYNFFKKLGFDREGREKMITVAGQFDIGLPWDRIFVGKAEAGRFLGSPVDVSYWISRTVFYPALIFVNPAMNPQGVKLINGSSSRRAFPWWSALGLRITKPSQEEIFKYPVLDTLVCYDHRFNERASKYWGFKYQTANGIIPGETNSLEPIDEGVMEKFTGQKGAFYPDLSGSEVQPFYLRRAGYDPVFSTNFSANMENLNRGVFLWMVNTHGASTEGGMLMFWDPDRQAYISYGSLPGTGAKKEKNPWRAYEWFLGSTEEPDTMTADIHGILPALLGNPNWNGLIRMPLGFPPAKKPLLDILSGFVNLPIIKYFMPEWLKDRDDYYDGVVITVLLTRIHTGWFNAYQIDENLSNLHSCGVSSVACLPAGKYLHLTLVRHGSVFQIMDPWATSWYSDVWQNSVPRGIALGKTIGEIYTEGISKVGILYITEPPQWWWDLYENVVLFGDPDLRIWAPSTEYSDANHWDKPSSLTYSQDFTIDGHMPFGATSYPHKVTPTPWMQYTWLFIIVAAIAVIAIATVMVFRKRK
jgi:hypothetical protein